MAEVRVVDLAAEYNREHLTRFYEDFMVPNFGQFEDELEPLEYWVNNFEDAQSRLFRFHVILLFDSKTDVLLGGVACEYYPISNCGLLTYIAVDPNQRQRNLGRTLVSEVLKALNGDAIKAGKAGCHAIFLETNSDKVDSEKDVMVPAVRRKVLSKLGFRILRFDYVQPALTPDLEACRDLLLTVHESFVPPSPDTGRQSLSSEVLFQFLREFFIVLLGEKEALGDPDFAVVDKFLHQTDSVEVEPVKL